MNGPAPPLPVRHQPQRRHLGAGIDAGRVGGEATDGGHPPWPYARLSARLRLLGPRQCHLDRHGARPVGIEIADEARQQPPGLCQLVSQRPTQPQVVDESLLQRARRAALILFVRLLVSLAGSVPSCSTSTSRRCQGCFPPSPASPRSGCPQLRSSRCDDLTAESFHLRTVIKRLVAHGFVFRTNEMRVGSGASCTPRLRCSRSRRNSFGCPLSTASPALGCSSHLPELPITKP